jgi:hypothetical protein
MVWLSTPPKSIVDNGPILSLPEGVKESSQMRQLPVARETESTTTTRDRSDIIGIAEIIDLDKLARLTAIVFGVLLTVYITTLCLAIVVEWPLVSTGLSISSILSGVTFGIGMVIEIVR